MNPKFYVISGRKVGAGVATAAFLATEGRAGHQAADRDERGDAAAIGAEGRVPFVERLDGRLQATRLSRHSPTEFHIKPRTSASRGMVPGTAASTNGARHRIKH